MCRLARLLLAAPALQLVTVRGFVSPVLPAARPVPAAPCAAAPGPEGEAGQNAMSKPLAALRDGLWKAGVTAAVLGLAVGSAMLPCVGEVQAFSDEKRSVGEIGTSGFLFKDKLTVEAFSDPKVEGVVLYISDFTTPITDKLSKGNFFSDPSTASMTCVRTGKMAIKDDINTSKGGEEVFQEGRSLFKSIKVNRIYDKDGGNIVYVSYSAKFDPTSDDNKSRFKSSLCALHID